MRRKLVKLKVPPIRCGKAYGLRVRMERINGELRRTKGSGFRIGYFVGQWVETYAPNITLARVRVTEAEAKVAQYRERVARRGN